MQNPLTSLLRRARSSGQKETSPPSHPELEQAHRAFRSGKIQDAFAIANRLKAARRPIRGVDYLRALCFVELKNRNAAVEALREELRYFPDQVQAARLLKKLHRRPRNGVSTDDPEFRELYEIVAPYTMVGRPRLHSLFRLAREVCDRDIPGNLVECGVAAGGSSALLAAAFARHSKRPRQLFAFDTFEGMPEASPFDTHRGRHAEETGWGAGTCAAPLFSLSNLCRQLGVENLVLPVKGLFHQTLPQYRQPIGAIALLHMDGDWYSSTRDILENLFDLVVVGGFIQIDDYGFWEGCQRAVVEFEKNRGMAFPLNSIDGTGVWMRR